MLPSAKECFLGGARKKFVRRSLPRLQTCSGRNRDPAGAAKPKQNDAVPQGAMGVFPVAVTEHDEELIWRETRLKTRATSGLFGDAVPRQDKLPFGTSIAEG
jgi:hypothetical protein